MADTFVLLKLGVGLISLGTVLFLASFSGDKWFATSQSLYQGLWNWCTVKNDQVQCKVIPNGKYFSSLISSYSIFFFFFYEIHLLCLKKD